MAHAAGYERVIFGTSPDGGNRWDGGNCHAAADRQGVPAILVETGQLGDRDPATVRRLLDGLYRLLHHLGVIETPQHLAPVTVQPRDWIWTGEVASQVTGLWAPRPTSLASLAPPCFPRPAPPPTALWRIAPDSFVSSQPLVK